MTMTTASHSPLDLPTASSAAAPLKPATRRIRSQDLLQGRREIEIDHDGALYRLRETSRGKLIMTK